VLAAIAIVTISILIAFLELPKLMKEKAYKEIWVFIFFLLCGMTLNILFAFKIPLPNPIEGLMLIFSPISNWIENLLS
jgi:hypothetical protein